MDTQRRKRRGAYSLEYALIMPVFLMFLLGIIEYSYFFFVRSTVLSGTQEGCRAGAVTDPDVGSEDAAADAIEVYMDRYGVDCSDSSAECEVDVITQGDTPETVLICDVDLNHNSLTNFPVVTDYIPTVVAARSMQLLELQR